MEIGTVGQRIKWLRLTRNIRQADLARQCGIQAASLWRIETQSGVNLRTPSRKLCIKIAEILGCSLDWLILGTGRPDDTTPLPGELDARASDFESSPTIRLPRPEAAG